MTLLGLGRALCLACALGLAGCDPARARIVGKWKVEGDPGAMVWEFAKNGGVKAGGRPGKYSFGDRGRLKIQTQFATFVYELEFAEDRMIWKEPNGSRTTLQRIE